MERRSSNYEQISFILRRVYHLFSPHIYNIGFAGKSLYRYRLLISKFIRKPFTPFSGFNLRTRLPFTTRYGGSVDCHGGHAASEACLANGCQDLGLGIFEHPNNLGEGRADLGVDVPALGHDLAQNR